MKTTAIVLAGGKCSRMGIDKGLCMLNGKPMVQYITEILRKICDTIIIGANNDEYKSFGDRLVYDEIWDIGPIGGIYSCLLNSGTTDNIVVSCDTPLINHELIGYILANKSDHEIVVPTDGRFLEMMCAYYHKDTLTIIKKQIDADRYKLLDLLPLVRHKKLLVHENLEFYHTHLFYNVNKQEDLDYLERHGIHNCHDGKDTKYN